MTGHHMGELNDIEWLIVKLVAQKRGDTASNVLDDLRDQGEHLPVSSIETVEILVELGEKVGVQIPPDEVTADDLRSVRTLAAHVQSRLSGSGVGTVGA